MAGSTDDAGRAARAHTVAWALLAFAPLAWASNVIVGRALAGIVPPDLLNLLRWGGTALLLAPVVLPGIGRHAGQIAAHIGLLVAGGVLGMGLFQSMVYLAVQLTTATHAATAQALSPLVALLATARRGPASRRLWAGFALSLLGVLAVQADGLGAGGLSWTQIAGDAVALVSALLWGAYGVLAARLPRTIPPLTSLFVMSAVATAVALVPVLVRGSGPQLAELPGRAWLAGAYLAVVVSILGLAAFNFGARQVGAARSSLFIHLTPVFAILLASAFLGERIGIRDVLGFGLIAGGMGVALTRPSPRAADG